MRATTKNLVLVLAVPVTAVAVHAAAPPKKPTLNSGGLGFGFNTPYNPYGHAIGPFNIFDAHCRTPEAWAVALQWGIGQTPLMTKARYYNANTDDIDLAMYAQKIWTPGARPECTAF